jgi:hypothetical protein
MSISNLDTKFPKLTNFKQQVFAVVSSFEGRLLLTFSVLDIQRRLKLADSIYFDKKSWLVYNKG